MHVSGQNFDEKVIFCTNCGTKLPANVKFCAVCGTAVLKIETNENTSAVNTDETARAEHEKQLEEKRLAEERYAKEQYEKQLAAQREAEEKYNRQLMEQRALQEKYEREEHERRLQKKQQEQQLKERIKAEKAQKKANRKPVFCSSFFDFAPQKWTKALLSVFLCFVIFIIAFYAVAVIQVRNSTSYSGVKTMLNDNNIAQINIGDETLTEYVIGVIDRDFDYLTIDEEAMDAYINRKETVRFVAREVSDLFKDIYEYDNDAEITQTEIAAFLNDGVWYLSSEHGLYSDGSYVLPMSRYISEMVEDINASTICDEAPVLYYGLNIGCSFAALFFAIIICIALLILLAKVKDFSILRILRAVGIVFTLVGAIYVVAYVTVMVIPDYSPSLGFFILKAIAKMNIGFCMVILAIGVVLLSIRAFIKHFVKSAREEQLVKTSVGPGTVPVCTEQNKPEE